VGLLNNLKSLVHSVPTEPIDNSVTNSKKILIVEDDQVLREFYVNFIKQEGYTVVYAENGQQGLTITISEKPDLIILDLMMPIMDGKDMLRELRKIPDFKTLPVIILSNYGSIDNIQQTTFYYNVSSFLIKSNITPDELSKAVKELI
jgi:DNA-binding response OmpR family regulator